MVNMADELLGGIDDVIGGGLEFFDKVKESVSKAVDTAKTGAKQYAASTPQGQAVMAAQSAMKKQESAKGSPTTSTNVIPAPGQKGGIKKIFSGITKKKIFGIPLVLGLGGLGVLIIMRKKR